MRILCIEDDRTLGRYVHFVLSEDGYAVDLASTGQEGRTLAMVNDYDALILDLTLPDQPGLQVLQALRARGRTTPVLVLTGRDAEEDVVQGLDAGADDYVVKPVAADVLKARLRALLRRGGAQRGEVLVVGDVVLDRLKHDVRVGGREVKLTPREFSLLQQLMLRAGQVVSRSHLLDKVWDVQFDPGSNVVDAHVSRLRSKLAERQARVRITGVRGAGFRLEEAEEAPAGTAGG